MTEDYKPNCEVKGKQVPSICILLICFSFVHYKKQGVYEFKKQPLVLVSVSQNLLMESLSHVRKIVLTPH